MDLQRSHVGMTEAEQVPVATLYFLLTLRQMSVGKGDSFTRTFNRAEPTMKMVAGFFGSTPESLTLAIHISEDKVGVDPLKRPHDFTAADVATMNDRLNVMFPKEPHGTNCFVHQSMCVADDAES